MKEANKIVTLIKKQTGVDVFENKRTKQHAEYRSLLCFILRVYFGMTLYEIRDYFKSKGKNYNHATALYAINKFELYRQFNKQIESLLYYITKKHINPNARNFKRGVLSHKIDYIEDKYVDSLLDIVEKLPFKKLHEEKM
mgnify:FL=1|tara:strand:- start:1209 stop:1628 length:420 start_codon:yes stop_codon:yes gene_type:complete